MQEPLDAEEARELMAGITLQLSKVGWARACFCPLKYGNRRPGAATPVPNCVSVGDGHRVLLSAVAAAQQ